MSFLKVLLVWNTASCGQVFLCGFQPATIQPEVLSQQAGKLVFLDSKRRFLRLANPTRTDQNGRNVRGSRYQEVDEDVLIIFCSIPTINSEHISNVVLATKRKSRRIFILQRRCHQSVFLTVM